MQICKSVSKISETRKTTDSGLDLGRSANVFLDNFRAGHFDKIHAFQNPDNVIGNSGREYSIYDSEI